MERFCWGWIHQRSGTTRNCIARLNADGTLDTGFNPNVWSSVSPYVYSLAVQADGQILLGGDFDKVGGITRTNLARLSANGTLDAGFNPNARLVVFGVAVQATARFCWEGTSPA